MADFEMTPEEQFLYQMHQQNLSDGGVVNPDGTHSTLRMSTIESDGKTFAIPTVWQGKVLDPKKPEEMKQIMAHIEAAGGLDKFPSYASEEAAEARYDEMHKIMEQDRAPIPQPEEGKVNPMRRNFMQKLQQEKVKAQLGRVFGGPNETPK